jgi:hypothetical protein
MLGGVEGSSGGDDDRVIFHGFAQQSDQIARQRFGASMLVWPRVHPPLPGRPAGHRCQDGFTISNSHVSAVLTSGRSLFANAGKRATMIGLTRSL